MNVAQLIAKLQTLPQDATVGLNIGNPKDSAFTDDVQDVTVDDDGSVSISGWVASDNENAYMPGYESEYED